MTPTELWEKWHDCRRCQLWHHRTKIVLWRGELPARVVFVAEAPGRSENGLGVPFAPAAEAGKVFEAIRLECGVVANYGVTNIVSCPPKAGPHHGQLEKPDPVHAEACRERLMDTLKMMGSPYKVVLMGNTAKTLFPKEGYPCKKVKVVHPSHIAREKVALK